MRNQVRIEANLEFQDKHKIFCYNGSMDQELCIIKHANMFDGIQTSLQKDIDILISGTTVKEIKHGIQIFPGVKIIDASGFTIIPGLIDCHTHFRSWMPPLFFQFGITTIRDVGSDPDWIISFREKEKNGDNLLPRIICYGPLLDGVPAYWGTTWKGSIEVRSLKSAQKITKSLIEKGVDGFKTYTGLSKNLMEEIVKIAHENNLPVASDLWNVSAWDAAAMGITSIEHASGILFPLTSKELALGIELLLKKNVFIDPTFMVSKIGAYIQTVGNEKYPYLNLIPEKQKKEWLEWKTQSWHRDIEETYYRKMQEDDISRGEFIFAYHKAGGKIVAGSDTPNPFVIPGFSLHQEIQRMVEIGLTPIEALQTATSNAAELVRRTDIGVIKENALADLVFINGSPTENIHDLQNIHMVMKNGKVVFENKHIN